MTATDTGSYPFFATEISPGEIILIFISNVDDIAIYTIFISVGMQLPSYNCATLLYPKTDENRVENRQFNGKTAPGFFLRHGHSCRVFSLPDSGMRINLRIRKTMQICLQVK
ncbi:MAG: hypothetical protein LUQ71_05940 [Methanoregula sp.]|nr:hypothetical protein [Methanoregula sp.]